MKAYETTGASLPHEEPSDIEHHIENDHLLQSIAEVVKHDDSTPHEGTVQKANDHVDGGAATRDD